MSTQNQLTGNLPPQSLLQERYMVIGARGRGGMSVVYEARDNHTGQHVAIKEMSSSAVDEEDLPLALARFQQEASMLHALTHPNLPRIHDAFTESGRSYLVMDYINGKTLLQLLREYNRKPLPVTHVLHYIRQLCDVLNYLHQHKPPIIFRDVKPTNIMVTAEGTIFLIDFGIARFFKEGQEHDTEYLGSRGYAAPEQHGLGQTTPRTDIYGLGVTLHHCLTGQDPYHSTDPFLFTPISHINPQAPPALASLVHHMIAYDEDQRPDSIQTVREVLSTLAELAMDATSTLQPPAVAGFLPAGKPSVRLYQSAGLHLSSSRRPSFWQPFFLFLFLSSQLITLSIATGALTNFVPESASMTLMGEAVLTLLIWFLSVIGYWRVPGSFARCILALTSITSLCAGSALLILTLPELQNRLSHVFSPDIPYHLLADQIMTGALVATGLISLLWLLRSGDWGIRMVLFSVFLGAIACTMLQAITPEISWERHVLLSGALLLLFLGTVLAIRSARVHHDRAILPGYQGQA